MCFCPADVDDDCDSGHYSSSHLARFPAGPSSIGGERKMGVGVMVSREPVSLSIDTCNVSRTLQVTDVSDWDVRVSGHLGARRVLRFGTACWRRRPSKKREFRGSVHAADGHFTFYTNLFTQATSRLISSRLRLPRANLLDESGIGVPQQIDSGLEP